MKTKRHTCGRCSDGPSDKTEHTMLGYVPQQMFEDENPDVWVKASLCNNCGGLCTHEIKDREMDWAERRFLRALVDTGNMDESEAREILDK